MNDYTKAVNIIGGLILGWNVVCVLLSTAKVVWDVWAYHAAKRQCVKEVVLDIYPIFLVFAVLGFDPARVWIYCTAPLQLMGLV